MAKLTVKGMANTQFQRFSWVFVREEGGWKIAQAHLSFPRSNLETIGVEHSALDELIESARESFDQIAREGTATVMFLVTDATRATVGNSGDFRCRSPVQVMLKGMDGQHSISALEWA